MVDRPRANGLHEQWHSKQTAVVCTVDDAGPDRVCVLSLSLSLSVFTRVDLSIST